MAEGQPTLSAPSSQIYAIRAADGPHVKIGVTINIESRLAALQAACPIPLRVEQTVSGGFDLEALLHRLLSEHRTQGEWFLCDGVIIGPLFSMLRDNSTFTEHLKQLDALTPAKRKQLNKLLSEASESVVNVALALRLPEFICQLKDTTRVRSIDEDRPGNSVSLPIRWQKDWLKIIDAECAEAGETFAELVKVAMQREMKRRGKKLPEAAKPGRPPKKSTKRKKTT